MKTDVGEDIKINRRGFLKMAGLGTLALLPALKEGVKKTPIFENTKLPNIPSAETVRANFELITDQYEEILNKHNRKLIHMSTYPMNTVMTETLTRAFERINNFKYLAGKQTSFNELIDLDNSEKTYPEFQLHHLLPFMKEWAEGACLSSTMFVRGIFPLGAFRILEAYSHPISAYPLTVKKYKNQITRSIENFPLSQINVGVQSGYVFGKQVDAKFVSNININSGELIFHLFDKNFDLVKPNKKFDVSSMSRAEVESMPREYYYVGISVTNTLANQGIVNVSQNETVISRAAGTQNQFTIG